MILSRIRITNICRQYQVISRTLSEKAGEPLDFVKVNNSSQSNEVESLSKISEALSAIKAAKLEIVEALSLIESETAVLEKRFANLSASVSETEVFAPSCTEEVSAAASEEISVSATEEISVSATEEISAAVSEEISAAQTEEISVAATEEVSAAATEEISVAATEVVSAAETEKISAEEPKVVDEIADMSKKVGEKVAEKIIAEALTDSVKEFSPDATVPEKAKISSEPESSGEPEPTDAVFTDVDAGSEPQSDHHVVLEPVSSLPVISDESLARIARISDMYCTPVGYHLAMPFTEFVSIKKFQRMKQQFVGTTGMIGGIVGYGYAAYDQFPQYFGPEPTMIMGFDSLVVVGAGILGLSIVTSAALFSLNSKLHLVLSEKKKPYNDRLLDFNRRLNFHRCTGYTSMQDDFYGDKIADLSDYRYWVRKQQEKKAELAKTKKSFFPMKLKTES